MSRPRSTPRINLRFDNLEEIDRIELFANKDGLDLQNWLRKLVRGEIRDKRLYQRLFIEVAMSQFRTEEMLKPLVNETIIRMARDSADHTFNGIEIRSNHDK